MRILHGLGFVLDATRGYRLRPWKSPYLRWRMETYWGVPAERINRQRFLQLSWSERRPLLAFLSWAAQMRRTFRSVSN